jgi:hypothetical protein
VIVNKDAGRIANLNDRLSKLEGKL